MIGTTSPAAHPQRISETPHLTPYEKLVGLALKEYVDDEGCLSVTRSELAHALRLSVRIVQKALAKLEAQGIISTTRNSQGHLEKIDFLLSGIRENGESTKTENSGRTEGEFRENGGSTHSLPETPDRNKSSTALEAKANTKQKQDHHHYAHTHAGTRTREGSLEPKPATDQTVGLALGQEAKAAIEQEPKILTGWPRIQELWPHLTRDVFDLAWCQTMANRYGLAKLVDALETCFLKSIHQDTLNGPLKAYVTRICQNHNPDPIRSVQPPPKPDMLERLMAGEFRT